MLDVVGFDIHEAEGACDWGKGDLVVVVAEVGDIGLVEGAEFDGVLFFELEDHGDFGLGEEDGWEPGVAGGCGGDFFGVDFEAYEFSYGADAFGDYLQ